MHLLIILTHNFIRDSRIMDNPYETQVLNALTGWFNVYIYV